MLREAGKIRREDEYFPLLEKLGSATSALACRRVSLRNIVEDFPDYTFAGLSGASCGSFRGVLRENGL